MSYDYTGKVAIVTGASVGIGEATAVQLGERGAKVVLAARRKEKLEAVAEKVRAAGGEALVVPTDVTRESENQRLAKAALDAYGRIDILVLNAGRGNATSVEDTTDEILRSIFELNVFSLYYLTRAVLPTMKKQASGRIVTVASLAGKLGLAFTNAYAAAKHAAVGFSNVLRLELVDTGIEASVVCPGSVATEWAVVTEGRSVMDLVVQSVPRAREIAKERGVTGVRSSLSTVLTADDVARSILSAIEDPVPEIYTHTGSAELVVAAAEDRVEVERQAEPLALAMRETYAKQS